MSVRSDYNDIQTFAEAIERNLEYTDGGYTFIGEKGTEHLMRWAELSREARQRGRALLARGLRKGDTVALIIPDGKEFVLTFLGAVSVGVVPVPLYAPVALGKLDAYIESTATIIDRAGASMLISTKRVMRVLWSLLDKSTHLRHLESTEIFEAPVLEAPSPEPITPDDVVFLQFTSGSTATPKGVRVTHRSLLANCLAIMVDGLQMKRGRDVGVSWLPMFHDMGLVGFVLAPFIGRCPVVFIPTMKFARAPEIWMQTISRHRATITFGPNFSLALAVKSIPAPALGELDLSSLRAVGCGAEPNHPATLRRFVDHFGAAGLRPEAMLPCYGMAEATLAMSFVGMDERHSTHVIDRDSYHDQGIARPPVDDAASLEFVSCGRPFPGHELVIVDERDGHELPEGRIGEVVFRGPSVAGGYHGAPEATARTFTPEGLRTGDRGYLADGQLYLTGRQKDVIIIHGRNYDPQTVEWPVAEVPGIRKGNVVAFTRPGQTTEELVVVAEIRVEDPGDLAEQVRRRIQAEVSLAVADVVLLPPGTLTKTSSGKLQRAKTRQRYLDGELDPRRGWTAPLRGEQLTVARHVARSLVSRVRHEIKRRR